MLFVRRKGGVSHHPAAYASTEDIDVAAGCWPTSSTP